MNFSHVCLKLTQLTVDNLKKKPINFYYLKSLAKENQEFNRIYFHEIQALKRPYNNENRKRNASLFGCQKSKLLPIFTSECQTFSPIKSMSPNVPLNFDREVYRATVSFDKNPDEFIHNSVPISVIKTHQKTPENDIIEETLRFCDIKENAVTSSDVLDIYSPVEITAMVRFFLS